jgi:hypothetical protein
MEYIVNPDEDSNETHLRKRRKVFDKAEDKETVLEGEKN